MLLHCITLYYITLHSNRYGAGGKLFNFVLPTDKLTDPDGANEATNKRGAIAAIPCLLNEALCQRRRGALRDAEINLNEARVALHCIALHYITLQYAR